MHYFTIIFAITIITAIFININSQLCSSFPDSTDLLQSGLCFFYLGFYTLSNAHSNQRQHCYTVLITDFNSNGKDVQAVACTEFFI
jgi:hypothetical protein